MNDDELLELAREAGWSACDPAMREKLLKFGRLVAKRRNNHAARKTPVQPMPPEKMDPQD